MQAQRVVLVLCSAGQKRHTIAVQAKSGTLGAGQRHTSGVQAQRGARGSPGLPGTKCRPLRAPPPGPSLFCPLESPYEEYTLLRGFPVQCLLRKRTLETYWIYIIWSAPSHWANNNRGNNRRVSSFLEWAEGVWTKVIQWSGSTIWCWGENRRHGDRRLLSFSRGEMKHGRNECQSLFAPLRWSLVFKYNPLSSKFEAQI